MLKKIVIWGLLLGVTLGYCATSSMVTYAGDGGSERFATTVALSNGTFLVGGQAQSLDWIPASVPRRELAPSGINSSASGQVAFIMQLSADLGTILAVVHFPVGSVQDISRIRTTEVPGQPTGSMYISGRRAANNDGYYIARLNNNFVAGLPTACAWTLNIDNRKVDGSYELIQPWDVGSDGSVTYGFGQDYGVDWAAIAKVDAAGKAALVPYWPIHWLKAGGEYHQPIPTHPEGEGAFKESGIALKAARGGSLRSRTWNDFNLRQGDGNGNTGRKGRFPDDYYFKGPCLIGDTCYGGPGYSGYTVGAKPTQRLGQIVIDRRDNSLYFGYSTQSTLPGGNPDFEPAVVAMDKDGRLLWWNRLYKEIERVGENANKSADQINSPPDQYVDAVEVDYSSGTETNATIVVLARCHGNGVVNFWNGNRIAADTTQRGFQNQFTGSNGNIHIQYLARLGAADGSLRAATYVAEWNEGATIAMNQPSSDPLMDGWPSPNTGWPNVNTTRLRPNLRLDGQGNIYVVGSGRRTITTSNAYQKMYKPAEGKSAWNEFVRVYDRSLSRLIYSSLLCGPWEATTEGSGSKFLLNDICPLAAGGALVVGQQDLNSTGQISGNPVTTTAVPAWGKNGPQSQSALLARLGFGSTSAARGPAPQQRLASAHGMGIRFQRSGSFVVVSGCASKAAQVTLYNLKGRRVAQASAVNRDEVRLSASSTPHLVAVTLNDGTIIRQLHILP